MRVAVLASQFPLVSQTFVLAQVTGLLDRGHEVTVFSRPPASGLPDHGDFQRYDLRSRTRYWPRWPDPFLGLLSPVGRRAWRHLRRIDGMRTRELPARARAVAGEAPFDAILCHFGPQGLLGDWLREVGALTGPLAVVFHGYDATSYVLRNGPRVYSRLFDRAELLLPISENWRRRLLELGAPPSKIEVLRMGINSKRFEYVPRTRGADEAVRLLTVARLVEKKGVEYALRAVARAMQEGHRFHYVVVGDGPLRAHLTGLAAELGITEVVQFAGWADQETVVEHMARAHVLLAPSVTASTGDQEGIPVVLMEAMASGLPVLSTRHSGIPELVPDDFLVDERDVEQLAAQLANMARDPARWPEIGARLRAKVLAEFDLDALDDRLATLLGALGGAAPGP